MSQSETLYHALSAHLSTFWVKTSDLPCPVGRSIHIVLLLEDGSVGCATEENVTKAFAWMPLPQRLHTTRGKRIDWAAISEVIDAARATLAYPICGDGVTKLQAAIDHLDGNGSR